MLPATFQFTQSNLQDYVDCARRFQLRYLDAQSWPAVQVEPLLEHERHVERGTHFHRLVERHQRGIEADLLTPAISDSDLLTWWQGYLSYTFLHERAGERYPEFALSTELNGMRITAKFDLLVVEPGAHIYIFDWKTYRTKPPADWFRSRLQTTAYPYVLTRAGKGIFAGEIRPEQVTMIYWVAGAPTEPLVLPYSDDQFLRDEQRLTRLAAEIVDQVNSTSAKPRAWALTGNLAVCRFCEYRSLCERGDVAGVLDDYEVFEWFEGMALGLADVEEVGF
jgi:hypothetical protein